MASGRMTLDFLLTVLQGKGIIAEGEVREAKKLTAERERLLARQASRSKIKPRGGLEPSDPVDILTALSWAGPDGAPHFLDPETIMKAVAEEVGLPFRKIDSLELDLDLVTKILPMSFALKHLVVPVGLTGRSLEVAVCDPFDLMVLDDVRRVSQMDVSPVLSTKADIRKLISEFYGIKSSIAGAEGQLAGPDLDFGNLEQYVRLKSNEEIQATDQHVKNLVDQFFGYALDQRVSDIHIEPKRNETLIRMRIDGILHNLHRLPKVIHSALLSRIKTLSRLNIAEKRRPQDGRIKVDHQGKEAEVRVSTVPVAFGEKAVLRILDPDILFRDLKDLIFSQENLAKYQEFITRPHGIILVTGPTGSGKSTTLYSTLRGLATDEKNIVTVEDPIEMVFEGFNQIAVQPQVGITFGAILRHILRQDPDIIMIGEMRDHETVENAIQAALTGHLVLSTLHTNDAPSAVTRLLDLGAERFLVSSTVIGVIAQRLLRKICPACGRDIFVSRDELAAMGVRVKGTGPVKLKSGAGCEQCRGTGYHGRLAAMEVLPFTERLRSMIMSGEDAAGLKRIARSEGMRTLREDALRIMFKGKTTYQEVLRAAADE
ncbi:MAG: GspE/PulE family protein [Pseudomonadota bacterium]